MALLTAGWPLLNATVTDSRPLARGTALRIGPGGANSAVVRVGHGWSMRPAESNPARGYSLRRGAATVSVAYVAIADRSAVPRLWNGLRAILRISRPGLRLGPTTVITSSQGRAGRTGVVTSRATVGAATIFVGPSGTFAIEIIALAPRNAPGVAALAQTRMLDRSLLFPAGQR
jgi:hypothetical protein